MEDKYMKTPKGTLSPRQEELMLFLMGSAFSQAWKQCLKDFILLYRGMGCRSSE